MSAKLPVDQLELDLTPRTWGGKREGAGRKKSKTRRDPPHRSREKHVGRYPLHVAMRTRKGVGRLRCPEVFEALRRALLKVCDMLDFRIVHVSLQHNHVHLLVEADNNDALERGMRRFTISLARRINKALGRTGKVFEYRYHTTTLKSPTQTRNALVYVLNNWRRHKEDERGLFEREWVLDKYSSAIMFTEWANWKLTEWPSEYVALPVVSVQTWLLDRGWRLANKPIRTFEVPGRSSELAPKFHGTVNGSGFVG